jgi:hypothetical protein
VLTNAAALIKDGQDSLDDSYWDVKALIGSATVATTQTAQTMQSVRVAVPGFLATGQQFAEQFRLTSIQFTGIATDAHTFTSKFTAPRTTSQKIWEGVKLGALTAARIF